MSLYRVLMTACKTFYVEASSRDEAYSVSEEEAHPSGEYDWDFDDSSVEEMDEESAKYIREKRKNKIFTP